MLPSTSCVTGSVLSPSSPPSSFKIQDSRSQDHKITRLTRSQDHKITRFKLQASSSESESSILVVQIAPPLSSSSYPGLLGDMVFKSFFRYSKRVSKMRLRSRVFGSKMDPKTNSKRKNTTENRYRTRTSFFHRFVIAWGLENGSPEPH